MKRLTQCLAMFLTSAGFLLSPLFASAQVDEFNVTYPFKSAIIKYELTGIKTGEKTLYVKDGKTSEETIAKTQAFGLNADEHSLVIKDGEYRYEINLINKIGEKVKITPEYEAALKKTGEGLAKQLAGKSLEQVQKPVGKDSVLSRECEVYDIGGAKQCIWAKAVPLKTEGNVMGFKLNEIAVKIDVDVEIPDSKFQVPEGIKVVERVPPAQK